MVAMVILAVLLLIAAAAPRYGVDSRGEFPARRVRPSDDVRVLGRALGRTGGWLTDWSRGSM